MNAEDERFFRIGVECLLAEGCHGVVCDLTQSVRRMRRPTTKEEWEQVNLLLTRIIEFPPFGMRVALVGGEELLKVVRVPILLENYDTEELAIIRLTAEL